MASCPKDIKKQTNKNEIRVTWAYPVFEDNFDRPPVQLRITSNRNPGALFPWGRYQVMYTASDRAGNKATCEFFIEVGRKLKSIGPCVREFIHCTEGLISIVKKSHHSVIFMKKKKIHKLLIIYKLRRMPKSWLICQKRQSVRRKPWHAITAPTRATCTMQTLFPFIKSSFAITL